MRSQLESSFQKSFGLGTRTCRVVSHDSDPVVGVRKQTDDEGVRFDGPAEQVLRLDDLVEVLVPVLDSVADQFSANLFSDVRNRCPGYVDCGAVERSRADSRRSDLRQIFGRENLGRLGHRALAVGLVAEIVEGLDLDLVGRVEVLPLDSDDVEADVSEMLKSFLLEITLRIEACSSVVDSVVDARGVLLLQGQRFPEDCQISSSAAATSNIARCSAGFVRQGVVLR